MNQKQKLKPGTRVRMSEGLKVKMRGECGKSGKHTGPWFDDTCFGCSSAHVDEFKDCVGVVEDPMFAEYPQLELNVRWEPSKLRYGYLAEDLIVVKR